MKIYRLSYNDCEINGESEIDHIKTCSSPSMAKGFAVEHYRDSHFRDKTTIRWKDEGGGDFTSNYVGYVYYIACETVF